MSERAYQWTIRTIVAISFFVLGVGVGNHATRRVLQIDQTRILRKRDIVPGSEFCSVDGKNWWPARQDGQCYAQDEPGKP